MRQHQLEFDVPPVGASGAHREMSPYLRPVASRQFTGVYDLDKDVSAGLRVKPNFQPHHLAIGGMNWRITRSGGIMGIRQEREHPLLLGPACGT